MVIRRFSLKALTKENATLIDDFRKVCAFKQVEPSEVLFDLMKKITSKENLDNLLTEKEASKISVKKGLSGDSLRRHRRAGLLKKAVKQNKSKHLVYLKDKLIEHLDSWTYYGRIK